MTKCYVLNPLDSVRPTGMGHAGEMVRHLVGSGAGRRIRAVQAAFRFINDSIGGVGASCLRLLLVQIMPLIFPRGCLVFTCHHAPLWQTRRHIVVIHDYISLGVPFQHRIQTAYFLLIVPRVMRVASRVVVISEYVRRWGMDLGISEDLLREAVVVPSLSPALVNHRHLLRNLAVRRDRVVLMIGARYPHKNVGLVFALVRKFGAELRARNIRIIVVGVASEVIDQYSNFEPDIVTLHRYVDSDKLDALLGRAALLCCPSLYEGQGLTPLEAMAAGCMPLCSDAPVFREVCGDGSRYFSPVDPEALLREIIEGMRIMEERDELDLWRRRADRILSKYSEEAIREKWRTVVADPRLSAS